MVFTIYKVLDCVYDALCFSGKQLSRSFSNQKNEKWGPSPLQQEELKSLSWEGPLASAAELVKRLTFSSGLQEVFFGQTQILRMRMPSKTLPYCNAQP